MNSAINQKTEAPNKEEDEEEEALSLSDFPLNSDEREKNDSSKTHHSRRSPSEYSFEFSNEVASENMSHAEDIISCGKLVPYNQPLFDEQILKSASGDDDSINLSRRYCDSLPETNPTRSNNSASVSLTRSSRSLDSRKLRRNSSLVLKSEASDWSYSKRSAKSEGFTAGLKPRWYYLMFVSVKFPPEMDIRDMKNRQVRRSPGKMFPVAPVNRRSSWGYDLLRVLSCKNHPSVAVASPDCRRLLRMPWTTRLFHVSRMKNQCADALAKLGYNNGFLDGEWDLPPQAISSFLRKDSM